VTLQAGVIGGWAMLAALLLSTQFLAQPFVWEDFPLDEIVAGWAFALADHLLVTMSIAVAVTRFAAIPSRTALARSVLVVTGIFVGAFVGESLSAVHNGDAASIGTPLMLFHVGRWSVISFAVVGMFVMYRRVLSDRVNAHNVAMRATQSERQVVEARLQLLRAQIEPHFLFNTLATIRRLQQSEPGQGDLMLANFIDYLRAAMPDLQSPQATLGQELDLVRAYLGLVAVRLSGRMTWSVTIDAGLEAQPFPALTLATLIENAIKHGIEPSPEGGHIDVAVREVDGMVEASVTDSGVGLSSTVGGGSGIGLSNTKARLASLYGEQASLHLEAHAPRGVRATIRVPVVQSTAGARP